MIEIIKSDYKINFINHFRWAVPLSTIVVLASLYLLFTQMNYGVDFRGGAELQVSFTDRVDITLLRKSLAAEGFSDISVQTIGEKESHTFLLKVPGNEDNLNQITQKVSNTLVKTFPESFTESASTEGKGILKVDIVGPKAGAELRISGFEAMLWALIAIMVYIGLRFDLKYSPGAIIALFHDVSIVLGFFAITGTEFTLQTVAALLAVIGYSVNDTVIVYDRVREHEARYPGLALSEHINNAVNETLSRTILTSGTTLFVSVTMYAFGGLSIRDFFMAISLGVFVGTYSSIFIAAPITLFFEKVLKRDKVAA